MFNRRTCFALVMLAALACAGLAQAQAPAAPQQDDRLEGVVNLNTATIEQLVLLPRVGEALAKRIVEYRTKAGGFKKVEELLQVRGIGERTFDGFKTHLAVSGSTTLKSRG
jgi:competence protein ComEA